jgi:hypothetical protein
MTPTQLKRLSAYAAIALAASAGTLLAVRARAAGIPDADVLTYTGYLENPDGSALTGKHAISVRFLAAADATKALCTGDAPSKDALVSGRFQVPLPDCADIVKANPNLFVDVQVDGAWLGATKLGAVPYAIEAGRASDAGGALDARIAAIEAALKNFVAKGDVPVVTEWQTYTPVLSRDGGTVVNNVTCTGRYRRVGDSVEIAINTVFSGVPTTGGNWYQWSLPGTLSIDASKPPGSDGSGVIGSGFAEKGIGNNIALTVYRRSAKGVSLSANGAGVYYVNDTTPFAMDATSSMAFFFTAPVVGWTATGP